MKMEIVELCDCLARKTELFITSQVERATNEMKRDPTSSIKQKNAESAQKIEQLQCLASRLRMTEIHLFEEFG